MRPPGSPGRHARARRRGADRVLAAAAPPATGRRRGRRLLGMLLGVLVTAALTCVASYALLMATAIGTAEPVSTGSLSLVLANNGTGFGAPVSNMLPTDTVTRYVEVSNNGLENGRDFALKVIPGSVNKLVTDATNGLQLAVSGCTATWNATTGVCSSGETVLLASTPLSTMGSASPTHVLLSTLAAGATAHLRLVLTLPDQTETTVDGTLPVNTIQGLTNTLAYTFSITQRLGTNTAN